MRGLCLRDVCGLASLSVDESPVDVAATGILPYQGCPHYPCPSPCIEIIQQHTAGWLLPLFVNWLELRQVGEKLDPLPSSAEILEAC